MKTIRFHKLHACGNDFVIILHKDFPILVENMSAFAKTICERNVSVGADGLIFLVSDIESSDCAYAWHFYNSDGSRAEMCGNGARCVAWLAVKLGLAPAEHTFQTDAGIIHATVNLEQNTVKLLLCQFTQPETKQDLFIVNTGVPHAVMIVDNVQDIAVNELGAKIRHHPDFGEAGTNVNFVQVIDDENLLIRTYERGLEQESYACGTGAAAAALATYSAGLTKNIVNLKTLRNDILQVQLKNNSVYLSGPVQFVYDGEYHNE